MPSLAVSPADAEIISQAARLWREKPYFYAVNNYQVRPRVWQRKALVEIERRRRLGQKHVKVIANCCHTAGKTMFAGIVHGWAMDMHPGARGLTLAQTWEGVNNLLWPYIRTLHQGSVLGRLGHGRVLDTPRYIIDKNWFSVGMSSDEAANLEGHHPANLETLALRIIDEAKQVDQETRRATQAFLHSDMSVDLAISTPWTTEGWFYELWESDDPRLVKVKVTLKDLIAEGIPGAQAAWDDFLFEYKDESHPEFRARALAEFMEGDPFALVNASALAACMERAPLCEGAKVVGVDVARSTDGDETVITCAHGVDVVRPQVALKIRDTSAVARRAVAEAKEFGADVIRVDSVGVGGGVVDQIRAEGWAKVEEFIASSKADDPERYADRATEVARAFADRINAKTCTVPNSKEFKDQARQIQIVPVAGGRYKLDKKAGGGSPDRWDSAMIATAPRRFTSGRAYMDAIKSMKPAEATN